MTKPMLSRTMNPARMNAIANHPDVRPWIGGEGEIDLSPLAANPANVILDSDTGGFVLERLEAGSYECHTLFLPEGREQALAAAHDGLRYMFLATDCVEIQTKVPAGNSGADRLARMLGFRQIFTRENAFAGPDGRLQAVSYRILTFDDWKARDSLIEAEGDDFHDHLEEAKVRAGSALPTHPDDPAHDRAAGAAALMVRAGNARKAVWLYNRWARLAGYAAISLLSEAPPILDVVDAVVELRGDSMEILLCR